MRSDEGFTQTKFDPLFVQEFATDHEAAEASRLSPSQTSVNFRPWQR